MTAIEIYSLLVLAAAALVLLVHKSNVIAHGVVVLLLPGDWCGLGCTCIWDNPVNIIHNSQPIWKCAHAPLGEATIHHLRNATCLEWCMELDVDLLVRPDQDARVLEGPEKEGFFSGQPQGLLSTVFKAITAFLFPLVCRLLLLTFNGLYFTGLSPASTGTGPPKRA